MKINRMNSPAFQLGLAKWNSFASAYTGAYDLTDSIYAGMNNKITFVCPVHSVMSMDAKNVMAGRQCMKCAVAARSGRLRMTQQKVLAKFKDAHGTEYNYTNVQYKGQQVAVVIGCAIHGDFQQKPEFHWGGSGCPQCFHQQRRGASQRDTLDTFKEKLTEIFGTQFSVVSTDYKNSQTEIQVKCTPHNSICTTKPNWLLTGCNPCGQCNHMKSSQEDAIANYLAIFTPVVRRNRSVIKPKELDVYTPEVQLAVEYSGMYWHSHGDKDSEHTGKHKHFHKYQACAQVGIRLITIYESEWQDRPQAIKRLLRNAVLKSKGKLMARKCDLRRVSNQDATVFYEKYHPQGGAGSGEHYGLYWGSKIVACMRFVFGANDRGGGANNRVWTLGRYATRVSVAGGASRLFRAFTEEFNPSEIKSFSDNRYFSGAMYGQLGFGLEEENLPDYQVWSPKIGLRSKAHYQRRNLNARLQDHGVLDLYDAENDTRSESEMTYLMGARRIYDCGKKRWVWVKPLAPHTIK